MLWLDSDYNQRTRPDQVKLSDELTRQAKQRSIELGIKDLNTLRYGDAMFVGIDGVYSAEIKKAGEFIGDTNHCVQQMKKQLPEANFHHLFIYGEAEESPDGKSYELSLKDEHLDWERHPDSQISRSYKRRYYNVNWKGQRKILWRFRNLGIQVVEACNLEQLAFEMCNWYECGTTVGTTFSRLETEKFILSEQDSSKRDLMLSLMGLQKAGIGEEVADAIASQCFSIYKLIGWLIENPEFVASWPLRSSLLPGARKRTIGPAAVVKLRNALGL